jgi:ABC-type Na+ efflux pump permease subunit
MTYLRYLRSYVRYFIRSPWAPHIVACKLMDLAALALASLMIWLTFGGPLAWAIHTVALARIASMAGH